MANRAAVARRLLARAARQIRSTPHWIDRAAAGVLPICRPALTTRDLAQLDARAAEILALRQERKRLRAVAVAVPTSERQYYSTRWRGVALTVTVRQRRIVGYLCRCGERLGSGPTARAAVAAALAWRVLRQGAYRVVELQWSRSWRLAYAGRPVYEWTRRPSRRMIATAIRRDRCRTRAARPSCALPDTLGWRAWTWDAQAGLLCSPHRETPWMDSELVAEDWSDGAAIRGEAGIHARLMPQDWRRAGWSDAGYQEGPQEVAPDQVVITGVVERYDRYVIGETGWRAERVEIRDLQAPSVEIGAALQRAYPGVRVWLGGR